MNWYIFNYCKVTGEVLDLASDGTSSYHDFLPKNINLTKAGYDNAKKIDKFVDFNKTLPFSDNFFSNIFLFNAFYIVDDQEKLMVEINRILKNDGVFYLINPFISNEMPEPHDYGRLTAEGLKKIINKGGFTTIEILRFGERFTSMAYLLNPWLKYRILKLIVYVPAIIFDSFIPKKILQSYPSPIGYFCIIKK